MESLKAELDWLASVGSSALREDIEREQQRIPLDYFVGMTMSDALDFVNTSWTPDSIEVQRNFVPDSDGKWAYYVRNNVYLEYPGSYYLQVSETTPDYIYFIPSTDIPEGWHPCVIGVRIQEVSADEKEAVNPYPWYSYEKTIVWESAIQNAEFEGVEFIASKAEWPTMRLHAFEYNEEIQRAVHIWVLTNDNPEVANPDDYAQIIEQQYEYLQHMIASIQYQPE